MNNSVNNVTRLRHRLCGFHRASYVDGKYGGKNLGTVFYFLVFGADMTQHWRVVLEPTQSGCSPLAG